MRPASYATAVAARCLLAALVLLSAERASAQDWRPFGDTAVQSYDPPPVRRPRPALSPPPAPPPPSDPRLAPYGQPPRWDGASGIDRRTPAAPAPEPDRPSGSAAGYPDRRDPGWSPPPPDGGRSAPPSYQPVELAPIQRTDLAPVMAGDGSGLPHEFWRGIDLQSLERLMAGLPLPPRSAALAALWRKLLLAHVAAPSGGSGAPFLAVRLEALHRSGLIADEERLLAGAAAEVAASPVVTAMKARGEIGLGRAADGCATAKALSSKIEGVPEGLRAEVLLFAGYCAAVAQNPAAAGLAAELAREEGKEASLGLQVLDAIAAGTKPKLTLPKEVSVTEYRLMEVAGLADPVAILPQAGPALLAVLAGDERLDPRLRIPAAEAAARIHAIDTATLAAVYRSVPLHGGDPTRAEPALRRAAIFKAVETDRNPVNRTRGIRALLDDARRDGLLFQAIELSAPIVRQLQKVSEIGWFAETAIETLIAAGDYPGAREWVRFAGTVDGYARAPNVARGPGLSHWLALADIADDAFAGPRGDALRDLEDMAARGRLAPEFLHRLATVLDALDYHVPIPLWEAASRTPQPATGFLPETGVLTELQDAAKKKEFGRTVMLAMRTLGPGGAEGAHMIALGDAMRALRRAGLQKEARRIGLEALFAGWPRHVTQ